MASSHSNNENPPSHIQIPIHDHPSKKEEETAINYFQRAQWLRAAMLGANDGLVTVTSLMIGVGAVRQDIRAMLLAGFAGLFAGACSMAIGEFVSVYTQRDIEVAQIKREKEATNNNTKEVDSEEGDGDNNDGKDKLPNPIQAAAASALAFSVGAVVPLMGAVFIRDYMVRMVVVAALASLALLVFGGLGAVIGKTSVRKSCVRVLIGGWMAMAITFGLTKLIGFTGL